MTLSDLLVVHSAPTLAGIKCASLISLANLDAKEQLPGKELQAKGLSFMSITARNGTRLLLVYREKELLKTIRNEKAERILRNFGYDGSSISSLLSRLQQRFQIENCPHEVGLFLGYPAEDVEGFIVNNGRNHIISGLWKVYSSAENAAKTFACYRKCQEIYIDRYRNGTPISRLCVAV